MRRRFAMFSLMILLLLPHFPILSASDVAATACSIHLYGERHADSRFLDKELEIWNDFYHNRGMRHLFIEFPYYTAEYLNRWMKEDNDDILGMLYEDWKDSPAHNPIVWSFFKSLKEQCPETVFHGIDVGHQHNSTGARFLRQLKSEGFEGSESYSKALKSIAQGKRYYKNQKGESAYRENCMAENFILEFSECESKNVMGIFGNTHVDINALDFYTHEVPSMAQQLRNHFGDIVYTESLLYLDDEAFRVDEIEIEGKRYIASYFGSADLQHVFPDFLFREYWRIEGAYEDFKEMPKTGYVLPYDNYPMTVHEGDVFLVKYYMVDGNVLEKHYRSDGMHWNGKIVTEEFSLE